MKKIKVKKIKKETKPKLNSIGYPHDDPYGLVEAWWKIFTKPTEKNVTNKKRK